MTYQFETSGKLKTMTDEELAAADKDSSVIVCNTGILEDETPYWAYIAVKPSQYKAFVKVNKEEKFVQLSSFGTILKYGFDNKVPDLIKEEMKVLYGCDDNYMEQLIRDVQKARVVFLKDKEDKRISDIVAMMRRS